jgi:hypothetical protein
VRGGAVGVGGVGCGQARRGDDAGAGAARPEAARAEVEERGTPLAPIVFLFPLFSTRRRGKMKRKPVELSPH